MCASLESIVFLVERVRAVVFAVCFVLFWIWIFLDATFFAETASVVFFADTFFIEVLFFWSCNRRLRTCATLFFYRGKSDLFSRCHAYSIQGVFSKICILYVDNLRGELFDTHQKIIKGGRCLYKEVSDAEFTYCSMYAGIIIIREDDDRY